MAEAPERGCLGCGVTLVAMGAFSLIYPWPEKVEGGQGMALMAIRMGFICAGILGLVALGIGAYLMLLKKHGSPTNPPEITSEDEEEK